ncbi:MAG TPA: hypothetical protein DIV79_14395 [Opitutae bacterium]|nr:hypothetical protein [Opitutae bacterium]
MGQHRRTHTGRRRCDHGDTAFLLSLCRAQIQLGLAVALKIVINQLIDILIGTVPLLGDLMDVVFKANIRNARLLIVALDARPNRFDTL